MTSNLRTTTGVNFSTNAYRYYRYRIPPHTQQLSVVHMQEEKIIEFCFNLFAGGEFHCHHSTATGTTVVDWTDMFVL